MDIKKLVRLRTLAATKFGITDLVVAIDITNSTSDEKIIAISAPGGIPKIGIGHVGGTLTAIDNDQLTKLSQHLGKVKLLQIGKTIREYDNLQEYEEMK